MVVMAAVAVTIVMMKLTVRTSSASVRVMVPVSVDMSPMQGALMNLGGPVDFPILGMQDHGHLQRLRVRHG